MNRSRRIGGCVAVASQVALGCSAESPAIHAGAAERVPGTRGPARAEFDPSDRTWRDPKTSRERERAALFERARALDVCASTLGDSSMHTVVRCPPGMQYDHASERCFAATHSPSSAGDECRNGEVRCVAAAAQSCVNGRWIERRSHASGAACEAALLADRMLMIE